MVGFRSSLFTLLIIVQLTHIHCKKSFILVAPKEFDVGSNETLHVTLLDVNTPGTVSIRLLNGTGSILSETNENFDKEGSKKVDLEVPSDIDDDPQRNFRLQVVGNFGDYEFDKNETITLRNRKELLFVNTDKPFYKAGQTVRFRVLIVNSDLKPLKETPVGSVWITNRNRVRMAQWINSTFENGFFHQALELPEEPVLGYWTLHVEVNKIYRTKSFNVKEYVLPTFEVKITPPSYYLFSHENVTWKICAKYTYGKPVQGKLLTEFKETRVYYSKPGPTLRKEEEFDGCTDVTYNVTEAIPEYRSYGHRGLELFAKVIEHGTGTSENSTSTIYPSHYEFTISREDSLQYFRTGLPYQTKIIVRKPDSKPLPDEVLQVCAVMKRENWKKDRQIVDNINFCKDYKTDQKGEFLITIPPQPANTIDISVEVKSLAESENKLYKPNHRFSLIPWYSSTGHSLQIEPLNSVVECGSSVEFSVLYTSKPYETRKIYYQVMSKGDIVSDGIVTYSFDPKDDLAEYSDETYLVSKSEATCRDDQEWDNNYPTLNHIGKFTLKFDVDFKMSPRARLVLYSVTEEGNVLADFVSFEVKPCFQNQVELKFSEEKQFPGAKTTIQVSAAPQSICSIGIVDRSVYLLEGGDILSKSTVYDQLRNLDTSQYSRPFQTTPDYEYCSKKKHLNNATSRQSMEPVGFVDAITAFTKAGVLVLSDLELETRPCKPSFAWGGRYGTRACIEHGRPPSDRVHYVAAFQPQSLSASKVGISGGALFTTTPAGGGFSAESDSVDRTVYGDLPTSTVRTYFPETWMWEIIFINEEGELFLKENMPDSITEWQGTTVCVHPDAGLGISESVSIIAFQPFFTSLTLPYSVIRGETVPVIVTVFNYLKECLPIKIHLDQTEDYELHNGTSIVNECVCGDKSVTKRFFVKPKTLGEINITVTASTIKDEEVCENFDVADITRSDSLTKSLIVEAEGIPKEETKNIFFCMEDAKEGVYKDDHDLLLRDNIVEGSERAFISVTGDVMGPTLEGLDNLVRVPTGCGEQNMVTLVPNIVVLDYLKSTNRLTEKIRAKAVSNIQKGYLRQQKYRHYDGSYSAFGKHDQSGSMWLTAFVVRSFASASRYIDVDQNELERSRIWIMVRQLDNGCFPVIGMVHNTQMKGGIGKEDKTPAILTAYVLASLLLSGEVNDTVIEKASECIQAKNNPSDYALSIFAYTASLTNDPAAEKYLEELNKNAVTEGFTRYWENKDKSIAIETAAYAVLASLELEDNESLHFQNSGSAIRWLSLQRNSYGGFRSTQDTVIALEALAKYAVRVNRQKLNMGVAIKGNELDEIFQLDEENELLTQRIRVPTLPTGVEVEARGEGCALVQMVLRYNIPDSEASEYFLLSIQSQRKEDNCRRVAINICTSLSKVQNESNMVVMEIKMISGFSVVKDSVQELLNIPELEIKRFEIKDNQLNLYFVQLTDQNKCFSFDVVQEIVVEDTKPANVKIYDYYDQDKESTVSYIIDDECRRTT